MLRLFFGVCLCVCFISFVSMGMVLFGWFFFPHKDLNVCSEQKLN